jgi:hypothetical protein
VQGRHLIAYWKILKAALGFMGADESVKFRHWILYRFAGLHTVMKCSVCVGVSGVQ